MAQPGLELKILLPLLPRMMGLQECTTTHCIKELHFGQILHFTRDSEPLYIKAWVRLLLMKG